MFVFPELKKSTVPAFAELNRIQGLMNEMFNEAVPRQRRTNDSSVNIWSNDEGVAVQLDVPGVNPEAIKTTIESEFLIIEASIGEEAPTETSQCIHRERARADIYRKLRLPFDVEIENVTAEVKDGILTVSLPKAEAVKPKTIKVKAL